MKQKTIAPYLEFSNINLPQQLALCGEIAIFSETLGEHARSMGDEALDGDPFPDAEPIYKSLDAMIGDPHGFRVRFFEIIARELDSKETYAPLAWHRIYLGCRVLWAMTVAPLDRPHTLLENLELLDAQSPEYARMLIVAPRHSIPFSLDTEHDWIAAISGFDPAVRFLPGFVPTYVRPEGLR